jgi:hypothetical protein
MRPENYRLRPRKQADSRFKSLIAARFMDADEALEHE